MSRLTDQTILVTGGCGSIGSELVARILDHDPTAVRVIDTDETGLFNLRRRLGDSRVRYLLGDVRDRDRLSMAMSDVDVVFHAAALKHVELNEYNPFEAVRTNVDGTQNVVRTALEEEVESLVAVSTDKASNPVSVMGATKLLSERLVVAANTYKGKRETALSCVRFGNVLGSAGSVVPVFKQQIEDGGPVTVTDPDMTRFIMSITKATDLVLQAHERMTSGEVFVLKMPSFRVGDLAEAMIEQYAPEAGFDPGSVEIEVIGARPAERIHEKLISVDETAAAREMEDMYVIFPQIDLPSYDQQETLPGEPVESEYTSADREPLSRSELIELVDRHY